MTRLSLLTLALLAGCDDRIVEETHQPEAVRAAVVSSAGIGLNEVTRFRYPDGLECVMAQPWGSNSGGRGLSCNWPAPAVPIETPEARRLLTADCLNKINIGAPDLSRAILECHKVQP